MLAWVRLTSFTRLQEHILLPTFQVYIGHQHSGGFGPSIFLASNVIFLWLFLSNYFSPSLCMLSPSFSLTWIYEPLILRWFTITNCFFSNLLNLFFDSFIVYRGCSSYCNPAQFYLPPNSVISPSTLQAPPPHSSLLLCFGAHWVNHGHSCHHEFGVIHCSLVHISVSVKLKTMTVPPPSSSGRGSSTL